VYLLFELYRWCCVTVRVESDPVARLAIVTKSSTSLRLRWSAPSSSNAYVEFYLISYRVRELLACATGPGSWSPLIDVDADRRWLDVSDLQPFCKYEVKLSAYTMAGQGQSTVAAATTDAAGKCFQLTFYIQLSFLLMFFIFLLYLPGKSARKMWSTVYTR